MKDSDRARQLGDRRRDDRGTLDRHLPPGRGKVPVSVVETDASAGAYPGTARACYPARLQRITGTESAGSVVLFDEYPGRGVVVANIGSLVPPNGTRLLAFQIDGRLVTQYG